MKYCKDCKYYIGHDDGPLWAKCSHDESKAESIVQSVVDGSPPKISYRDCTHMRIYRDLCGKEAKLFEEL